MTFSVGTTVSFDVNVRVITSPVVAYDVFVPLFEIMALGVITGMVSSKVTELEFILSDLRKIKVNWISTDNIKIIGAYK